MLFNEWISPSYNPDDKENPYTYLTAEDDVGMEDFDDPQNLFEPYVLKMLGNIILLEEKRTGRMSGLRIFCRLDVSVFREQETGKHSFFVNEITGSHGAALFESWITHSMADSLFRHMSNILHLVGSKKLYLCPPTLP